MSFSPKDIVPNYAARANIVDAHFVESFPGKCLNFESSSIVNINDPYVIFYSSSLVFSLLLTQLSISRPFSTAHSAKHQAASISQGYKYLSIVKERRGERHFGIHSRADQSGKEIKVARRKLNVSLKGNNHPTFYTVEIESGLIGLRLGFQTK